ncbi:MAG: sulfurtransferase TusA family protein [Desulfobacula sp.]|uniref:sulfurtransferase TusA family protein n=1 Tax=Desulfobacula sp. TaxID=2593537 RepID=UPI0025BB7C77|nr:sulfurtransferase TusA family protein [Desulfobacula sp.]MCD4718559.1 sulfurtransferase TusA family protein [Desulfobacula sp.]
MDVKEINADVTLDVKGLSCPMPLLKTKKALKSMESGQIIEVLVTDPGFRNDLPDFIKKTGDECIGDLDDGEGFFKMYIKKS